MRFWVVLFQPCFARSAISSASNIVFPNPLFLAAQAMGEDQKLFVYLLDFIIFGLDHDIRRNQSKLAASLFSGQSAALPSYSSSNASRLSAVRTKANSASALSYNLGVGIEINPLVGVRDQRRRIDPLLVIFRVIFIIIFIAQALGAEAAGGGFLKRIVARLAGFEMVAVRAVNPVQGVGGDLHRCRLRRAGNRGQSGWPDNR